MRGLQILHWLTAVCLVLVPFLTPAVVASSSLSDLAVKHLENLHKQQNTKGIAPVQLNAKDFLLLTQGPRDFAVMASRMDLDEEFKLVAAAWNRAAPSDQRSKIVFATLDFKNGREVFQAQRITNVPLVRLYPATEGPYTLNGDKEFELYDANRRGYGADALAEYVQQTFKTNALIIRRPINYAYYATIAVSLLGILALAKMLSKQLVAIFKSNKLWSIITIACTHWSIAFRATGWTTLMCSGYMWNSIRQPPYTGMRNGRPELVAGGFQNQFVLETQIVGVLFPQVTDPTRQRTAAFVVLLVFIALYSALLKFFKLKNGGYPFKLRLGWAVRSGTIVVQTATYQCTVEQSMGRQINITVIAAFAVGVQPMDPHWR
ncbi:hypothetical protein BC832DRAFT_537129 [Gaertneriomyces semiglobifer]|nr:hypothetical protein BC832DRAFT_537129 [Gaertneriomyces semiglobifer]